MWNDCMYNSYSIITHSIWSYLQFPSGVMTEEVKSMDTTTVESSCEPLPNLVGKPYRQQADSIFDALFTKARQIKVNENGSLDSKDMEDFYQFSVLTLARLKILNRDLHLDIDSQRKDLNNRKVSLEKLQLLYENLLYEKSYLMRQIEETQDLSTPNLDEIASERGHRVEILTYHDNLPELEKQSLNELQQEMDERIATQKVLDELEEKSKNLTEVLDKKRRFMDELPKKIAHIRSTTMDLSRQFVDVLPAEVPIVESAESANNVAESNDVEANEDDTKMDEA